MRIPALPLAAVLWGLVAVPADARQSGMTRHATGTFRMTIVESPSSAVQGERAAGRVTMSISFSGGLAGVAREMMPDGPAAVPFDPTARTVTGRFDGEVEGRRGGFRLRFDPRGPRTAGKPSWMIVPGSGVGALAGIAGTIVASRSPGGAGQGNAPGYDFQYTLPGMD